MGLIFIIGLAAGAASALLAAGVAAGSLLAIPLFYLAPLPVMIAGLAFSPIAAGLAVVFAGLGLGLMFGGTFLLAYAVGMGGPAFALSYAALLARPVSDGREELAWFPVGSLVLMTAAFGSVAVWVGLLSMATDYETYKATVAASMEAMVGGASADADELESAGVFMARVLPPVAGLITMLSQLICLYLAGRAARISQRLPRPWPVLCAMSLSRRAVFVLAAAFVLTLLPGMLGLAASVAAATVLFAFALVGFAVVHAVTVGNSVRFLVLSVLWFTALVFGWPVLAMAAVGVADTFLDFRARLAAGQGPRAANDQ